MTKTQAEWAARVAAWRASGKTAREFAAEHSLSASTLAWWRSRLRRLRSLDAEAPATAVAGGAERPSVRMAKVVATKGQFGAEGTLVIELGGARIVVRQGFDTHLLRDVVVALTGTR